MIPEELCFTEREQEIYESDDPTQFPDKELADLWRKEHRRYKYYCEGERTLDERIRQNSMAVRYIEEVINDLQDAAKRKLNIHKTRCLKLAGKFFQIETDLKTCFLNYLQETGLNKHAKKMYGSK